MGFSLSQKSPESYLTVAAGFITLMSVGAVQSTFGNILPYLASYMASKDKNTAENYDFYTDQGTWIYVARAIFFVFGSMLGAKLANLLGGRIAILIGDIILSICVASCYFLVHSLEAMILVYGGIAAVGCGISYVLPLGIAAKWFPEHQAFISGVILSGYGLAGVIFSPVLTVLINPNDIELNTNTGFLNEDEVLNNIPSSFWKMALICFGMQILSIVFIKEAPNMETKTDNSYQTQIDESSQFNDSEIGMTTIEQKKSIDENSNLLLLPSETTGNDNNCGLCDGIDKYLEKWDLLVFKDGIFLNLWFTLFFSQMTTVIFSTTWKTFTNQQLGIESDLSLSVMGSISAFANAIGRIFWGYVNDKRSYIFTLGIMSFCDCLLLLTWPGLNIVFDDDIFTLTVFANIWLSGIFFFQIGIYNIMVRQIGKIYGIDKINHYYALLMLNQIPSGIFSALAVTQMRQTVGWANLSFIMSSFQFIAFCIVMSSRCVM